MENVKVVSLFDKVPGDPLGRCYGDLPFTPSTSFLSADDRKHAVDELFKASEHLQEALDTIVLCDLGLDSSALELLDKARELAERSANRLKFGR